MTDQPSLSQFSFDPYTPEIFSETISQIHAEYQKQFDMLNQELENILSFTQLTLKLTETAYPEIRKFYYWKQTSESLSYLSQILSERRLYQISPSGKPEVVILNSFLKEIAAVSQIWTEHTQKQLTLTLPDTKFFIYADPLRLRQVLFHLIKEILDILPESGSVFLSLEEIPGQVSIRIEASQPFSPKNQIPKALHASRMLIEAMNGSMVFHSDQSLTAVTISLPQVSACDNK